MRVNEIVNVRADDLRVYDAILVDGEVWHVAAPITLGATGMCGWKVQRGARTRSLSFYRGTYVERVGQPVVI